MTAFEDALAALDEGYVAAARERRFPGVAWGVVRDGELVHAGGTGTIRDGAELTPDAESVFRIASMTKSFTASALLLLRDEGLLGLDDPVARHVPALAGWRPPTADTPPITVRQLMTMSAGLPTDDPWGDRQQSMPVDAFEALLADGPPFAWPPGTMFEYSNLGYAILGRVVTAVAGAEYRDVVRERLLVPLGMTSSGFDEAEIDGARLAHGYVRRGDALVREGTDVYGTFASMGGLYSTVRDLARWVAGFLDAFPARDDPEGGHPLRRATRREMQQPHRMVGAFREPHGAHEPGVTETGGYGYGLFVSSIDGVGTVVGHGGGYPGYGSMMTWHPGSGIGVVALGNLRYAWVHQLTGMQLRALVRALARDEGGPHRPVRPLAAVTAARATVERLLAGWDDAVADAAFAMNMDLDEPREARRTAVTEAVASVGGPLHADPERPDESASGTHRRWWLRGKRGWLRVGMQLSPEPSPRIQALAVTAVLDPSDALRAALDRLLAAADGGAWPADVQAAADVDQDVVLRGLRVLHARLGMLSAGRVTAGDGQTTATWEIGEPSGQATIALTLAPGAGDGESELTAVTVQITGRDAPSDAW